MCCLYVEEKGGDKMSLDGDRLQIKGGLMMNLIDFILGKARKSPCKKCGNPYHFTEEHEWYH